MEKICLELPIISVDRSQSWGNEEYAKEHEFPKDKPFIADDGACYWFCIFDGRWVNQFVVPKDIFESHLAKMAEESILGRVCDRLEQIARLTGECKDEVVKSEARLMDVIVEEGEVRDREFNTLRDGLEALECSRGGGDMGGVNILDVARAAAVIQKPELIKEL